MSSANPQLAQGMRQSMVMGASMQLFLRALQATQAELSQMATQALNSNPALEEIEASASEDDSLPPPDQSGMLP